MAAIWRHRGGFCQESNEVANKIINLVNFWWKFRFFELITNLDFFLNVKIFCKFLIERNCTWVKCTFPNRTFFNKITIHNIYHLFETGAGFNLFIRIGCLQYEQREKFLYWFKKICCSKKTDFIKSWLYLDSFVRLF